MVEFKHASVKANEKRKPVGSDVANIHVKNAHTQEIGITGELAHLSVC